MNKMRGPLSRATTEHANLDQKEIIKSNQIKSINYCYSGGAPGE